VAHHHDVHGRVLPGKPIQDGSDAGQNVLVALATGGTPIPGAVQGEARRAHQGIVRPAAIFAHIALVEVRLDLKRRIDAQGDDPRSFEGPQKRAGDHELGLKQIGNEPRRSARLGVAQFRQRQRLRVGCKNTVAVAGTLAMANQYEISHATPRILPAICVRYRRRATDTVRARARRR